MHRMPTSSRTLLPKLLVSLATSLATSLVACSGSDEATPTPTPTLPPTTVTYEQVAPLLAQNCVGCHQAGGIAPIALDGYANASHYAASIKASVQSRSMPPYVVDTSGDCQNYANNHWLTQEEIDLLSDWADQGALVRDPAYQPPPPAARPALPAELPQLDMGLTYTPEGSEAHPNDDYRCFMVDAPNDHDMYLTGYEVVPGDPRVVHHVVLYTLAANGGEDSAIAADAADPRPGWTCFGAAGDGVQISALVAAWAPGTPVTWFPENTGMTIPGNRKMVIQMHYNLLSGVFPDRTTMKLELKESVEKDASMFFLGNYDFVLPPGQESVTIDYSLGFNTLAGLYAQYGVSLNSLTVYGVYPHMHTAGRALNLSMGRSGDKPGEKGKCTTDVPEWNFNWQQFFFYKEPWQVGPGDVFNLSCNYNTVGRTEDTTYGEGTEEEMCISMLYITADFTETSALTP